MLELLSRVRSQDMQGNPKLKDPGYKVVKDKRAGNSLAK